MTVPKRKTSAPLRPGGLLAAHANRPFSTKPMVIVTLATFLLFGFLARKPSRLGSIESSKEEAKVPSQIQESHATWYDRYPSEYNATVNHFANQKKSVAKILSFGCSTGKEALTLSQKYFPSPEVTIYGVDIDNATLATANQAAEDLVKQGKILFFNGKHVSPLLYGPYDIIFANSVLCNFVTSDPNNKAWKSAAEIMKSFPFETFDETVTALDSFLAVGGLLTIYNSNYDFMETQVGARYDVVKDCTGQFVPRIDRSAIMFVDITNTPTPCIFSKRL